MWTTIGSVKHLPAPIGKKDACILLSLEGTIITCTGSTKWQFTHDSVPDILRELSQSYDLYIVDSLLDSSVNLKCVCIKVESLMQSLGISFPVYISTRKDTYRKPRIGIWKLITDVQSYRNGLFIGDANGSDRKSMADLLFAVNVGIRYLSPRAVFESSMSVSSDLTSIYYTRVKLAIDTVRRYIKVGFPKELTMRYDLVLMVGPPASTKSTYCRKTIPDYVVVSADADKSVPKCVKECSRLLKDDFAVVIDNCNATAATRKLYIDVAEKLGKSVACVYFKISKDIALHMNAYRSLTTERHIPDIAIHKYYKVLEEPDLFEGIAEVLTLRELLLEYTDTLLYTYLLET